jgi:hypothetical protein
MVRDILQLKHRVSNLNYIEQQLSHEVRDMHGRAYSRTQYLRKRQAMMRRRADYLDELSCDSKTDRSKQPKVMAA